MLVSKNLRDTLRYDGYAKLAAQVMRDRHEYVGDITSLDGGIKSVSIKLAVNRMNQQAIWDGLASYRQLEGV